MEKHRHGARDAQRRIWRMLAAAFLILFTFSVASAQKLETKVEAIHAAIRNREFGTALELLGPVLQMAPRNEQLWVLQGKAYAGQGNNKEALASFRNALKIASDSI